MPYETKHTANYGSQTKNTATYSNTSRTLYYDYLFHQAGDNLLFQDGSMILLNDGSTEADYSYQTKN